MKASLSGKLASMGSGVPYALAAKMAYPQRPVLAIVGDGAMQMNGNPELLKQYCKGWSHPTFIVMVLVNHDLNLVTWEQRALAGDPKYPAAQDVIRTSRRLPRTSPASRRSHISKRWRRAIRTAGISLSRALSTCRSGAESIAAGLLELAHPVACPLGAPRFDRVKLND